MTKFTYTAIFNKAIRLIAMVMLVAAGIVISSLVTSANDKLLAPLQGSALVQFSANDANDFLESGKTSNTIHLQVRAKAKVKVFFGKNFSLLSAVITEKPLAFYRFLSYKSSILRPEYYNFLFRYKPF